MSIELKGVHMAMCCDHCGYTHTILLSPATRYSGIRHLEFDCPLCYQNIPVILPEIDDYLIRNINVKLKAIDREYEVQLEKLEKEICYGTEDVATIEHKLRNLRKFYKLQIALLDI